MARKTQYWLPTYGVPHPDSSPNACTQFFRPVKLPESKEEVEYSPKARVNVTLHDADIWKKLDEIGNEIMFSYTGR